MKNFKQIILPEISKTGLSMAYPSGKKKLPRSATVLAADVGRTKTELALFQMKNGQLISLKNERYPTSDYRSFVKAIQEFHDDKSLKIDCACLGVAAPVDGNKVKGTNFTWKLMRTNWKKY